jgi:hypothetical protein
MTCVNIRVTRLVSDSSYSVLTYRVGGMASVKSSIMVREVTMVETRNNRNCQNNVIISSIRSHSSNLQELVPRPSQTTLLRE